MATHFITVPRPRTRRRRYIPATSLDRTLRPDLFVDDDTFYAHTLLASVTLAPSLFSDADTFYTSTLLASVTIAPSLFSDGDTFFTHVVALVYPAWPAGLPQYFDLNGYRENLGEQVIEAQTDMGPPKARRRFTTAWGQIAGIIRCTLAQAATFEGFFRDDLEGGTLEFTWVNPITQAPGRFRFRAPAPSMTLISSDEIAVQIALWQVA